MQILRKKFRLVSYILLKKARRATPCIVSLCVRNTKDIKRNNQNKPVNNISMATSASLSYHDYGIHCVCV